MPSPRTLQIRKLTTWEAFYALDMAIACALSYAIITQLLVRFVDQPTKLLGGMWAVVATVFVFRKSRASVTPGSPWQNGCAERLSAWIRW